MTSTRLGLPSLYLAIFLLALTGLYAKLIPLGAVSIIQLRGIIAALALALFALLRRRRLQLAGLRSYLAVYGLGLLLGAHWVSFFHAMQVSSVAVGMLSMFSFPIITIFVEPLFSGGRLKGADLIAGLATLAGLSLMVLQGETATGAAIAPGVCWGILSACLFTLRNLLQKYRCERFSSDSLMFHQVVAVGLMLALFVDYPRVTSLGGIDLLKLVLLGLFSTAAAHTLLVFSLKQLPAKSVALISCLQPVIAVLLAWLVIGEAPDPSVALGGGVVLTIAAYESRPRLPAAEAAS